MSIIDGIINDDLNEFIKSVVKNKKNLKIISKRYNMSIFELAVTKNRVDMVEYLLRNSSKLGTSFIYGRKNGKLMMSAVSSIEMAELLHAYNFSVYEPNSANVINGLIDMWVTIGRDKLSTLVEWMLMHGANAKGDDNNWSPLMNATAGNHTEVMKLLVKYGADINQKDWNDRGIMDIVPNKNLTVLTAMSFAPILNDKQLYGFASDFPNELITHPELNKYIDKLIDFGFEHILPKELIDIFLF